MIGDGTRQLGKLHVGDTLNCLYPLGNGFTLPTDPSENMLLVGGGVGVAPLLHLGHEIKERGEDACESRFHLFLNLLMGLFCSLFFAYRP